MKLLKAIFSRGWIFRVERRGGGKYKFYKPSIFPFTPEGGGGWVLPYKRRMGMCRWMGSHFYDWSDYSGVLFSIELLEWGRTFSDFWGKTVPHISSSQTCQNVCTVGEK